MAFVRAAALAELAEGEPLGVEVEGLPVALVQVDGEVYAFADKCSHRDYPLSHGDFDVDECTITCEWHGAQFDVRTGAVLCLPATRPIPVYACKVEGDEVWVDVEA